MKFDLIYPLKCPSWGLRRSNLLSYQNTYLKRIGTMIMYTKFDQNQMKTAGARGRLFSDVNIRRRRRRRRRRRTTTNDDDGRNR